MAIVVYSVVCQRQQRNTDSDVVPMVGSVARMQGSTVKEVMFRNQLPGDQPAGCVRRLAWNTLPDVGASPVVGSYSTQGYGA